MCSRILISQEMRPLTSSALHGAFIVTEDLIGEEELKGLISLIGLIRAR